MVSDAGVLDDHLFEVPGALRFVVNDHVLRRHRGFVSEILLHVVLDAAGEGLAAAARAAQLVPQHLDKGLTRVRLKTRASMPALF